MARPITFLSDYGYDDEFAGVCRAVIAAIAPEAAVIDLTHGIRRHAIEDGAAVLANALRYAPPGLHLAVVDPGVGTPRRGVAIRVEQEERVLVGPDNGLLAPAVDRLGGAVEAVDISDSPFCLRPVAATFHGRDVFAPVAARLAAGAALDQAGPALDPAELSAATLSHPEIAESRVRAHAVYVDRFGNVSLDLSAAEVPRTGLRAGARLMVETRELSLDAVFSSTFGDVASGELILYEDPYGAMALAVNRASAAERLALGAGDAVTLRPA